MTERLEHAFFHHYTHPQAPETAIRAIYSPETWMEGEALQQLQTMAALPDMQLAVGLPDLHPGKGCPVGAAFWSTDTFYPFLIGNDIGCGMAFWQIDLPLRKAKIQKWLKKLDLESTGEMMGTIGGGNHFAELQQVHQVFDEAAFREAGLDANAFQLLVHSGSRGIGEQILRQHTAEYGNRGLKVNSSAAAEYLTAHDAAVEWAVRNRHCIKDRFLAALNQPADHKVSEVCHNALTPQKHQGKSGWLHRKGAAPTDQGLVMIPGSRGHLSYLVKPLAGAESGWSLAHGAGRKWTRNESKGRLNKYSPESLQRTDLGGHVVCEHKGLIYEEAPQAYKAIDAVVQTLVDTGLIALVASFQPVITYKTRRSPAERSERKAR